MIIWLEMNVVYSADRITLLNQFDWYFSSYNNSGIHIAIYIDKFKDRYTLFKEHNLIWTNPRFVKEDTCNTLEEACANRQFRFKNIIDPETDEVLFELEHETRSLRHFQFMKQVAYWKFSLTSLSENLHLHKLVIFILEYVYHI